MMRNSIKENYKENLNCTFDGKKKRDLIKFGLLWCSFGEVQDRQQSTLNNQQIVVFLL